MERNFYLIPGMGADHRLFSNYSLPGKLHFLNWTPHRGINTLQEYAEKMAAQIHTKNNVIIGSSMGGMVATELSRIVSPQLTVLISAPYSILQFPRTLRVLGRIQPQRAITPAALFKIVKICDTFMGFKNRQQRDLFYEMVRTNGPEFLHNSLSAVLSWKNIQIPNGPFIQISGEKDKLFHHSKMPSPIVLKNVGHFASFERAEQICEIINHNLNLISRDKNPLSNKKIPTAFSQ